MTIPRKIGWSAKAVALWKISKQLDRLSAVFSKVTITDVEEGGVPNFAIIADGGKYVITDTGKYVVTQLT